MASLEQQAKKPNSNTSEEQQQTQAITLQIQSPTMARPHMTYHVCAKTANHLRRTRNVLKCHVTGNDAKAALHHPRSNSSSSPSSSDDNDKRIGRSAKTVTLLLRSAWRHRDICDFHSKRKSVDVPEVFVTPSRSKSGAVAGSSVVKNVEWASEWELRVFTSLPPAIELCPELKPFSKYMYLYVLYGNSFVMYCPPPIKLWTNGCESLHHHVNQSGTYAIQICINLPRSGATRETQLNLTACSSTWQARILPPI